MRPISIVLLVVAALAAVGAVFFGNRIVQSRSADAAAAQRAATVDVEVLVAARDLPQGHVLKETDLRWDHWPKSTAAAVGAVLKESGKSTLAHAPGTAVRRNVVAGEPIFGESLFTPGRNSGFMAAMVSPGMKAVGVTVTAASTASGFVLPGDLVDVILTVDLRRNEVTLPGGGRFASEVFLRGVRVLAVDQALNAGASPRRSSSKNSTAQTNEDGSSPDEVAIVGKTVALEVTPADGERLLAAQAAGTLSLALRSLARPEGKDEPSDSFASDVNSSRALRMAVGGGVRIIKGGEVAR